MRRSLSLQQTPKRVLLSSKRYPGGRKFLTRGPATLNGLSCPITVIGD